MATATEKSRTARRPARRVHQVRAPASMEFRIFADNGGEYHWTIVAGDGATLVRSGGFASYHDAESAAEQIRVGAASAQLERRAAGPSPVDLNARRDAASDSDAGRWLDDGGTLDGGAVAKWPAPQ